MPRKRQRLVFIRDLFFWIGVALAGGGLSVVGASNTPFISHLERSSPPLSWMLAGGAIFALMIGERCNSAVHALSPIIPEPVEPLAPEASFSSVSSTNTDAHEASHRLSLS